MAIADNRSGWGTPLRSHCPKLVGIRFRDEILRQFFRRANGSTKWPALEPERSEQESQHVLTLFSTTPLFCRDSESKGWYVCWFSVSSGLEGNQFRRFGRSHSEEKVAFGHTNVPAGCSDETPRTLSPTSPTEHQRKQLPSGAPNRRGNVETATRDLSPW
jgi:hypothetical protein